MTFLFFPEKYFVGDKVQVWSSSKRSWFMGTIIQMNNKDTDQEKLRVAFGAAFPVRRWFYKWSHNLRPHTDEMPEDAGERNY